MDKRIATGLNRDALVWVVAVLAVMVWTAVQSPVVSGSEDRRNPTPDSNSVHTVTASVEYSTERVTGKQATLVPGEFTVPEGFVAGQFRYRWSDPKTGRESDRITATTVYSMTQRRYMSELKDNPNATLPPGKYKLVVGGLPGATGTLTYRLRPQANRSGPSTATGDRIIDVETWMRKPFENGYNPKYKATYVVCEGKVIGTIDQLVEGQDFGNGIMQDPRPFKGTFNGRIEGNVITGTWEVQILPHKIHFPGGKDQPAYDRTDSCTLKYEIRLTLNPDGTVSQTEKGTFEMTSILSPNAPPELGNKTQSVTGSFSVPDENIPDPLTGRWTERTSGPSTNTPEK